MSTIGPRASNSDISLAESVSSAGSSSDSSDEEIDSLFSEENVSTADDDDAVSYNSYKSTSRPDVRPKTPEPVAAPVVPAPGSDVATAGNKTPPTLLHWCCIYLFGGLNFFFMFVGLAMVGVGVLVKTNWEVFTNAFAEEVDEVLTELHAGNVSTDIINIFEDKEEDVVDFLTVAGTHTSTVLIAVGSCVIVLALIGCCDVIFKKMNLMTLYLMFLLAIVISEIVLLAIAVDATDTFRTELKDDLRESLRRYDEEMNDTESQAWSSTFYYFKCCGLEQRVDDFKTAKLSKHRSSVVQQSDPEPIPIACCKNIDYVDLQAIFINHSHSYHGDKKNNVSNPHSHDIDELFREDDVMKCLGSKSAEHSYTVGCVTKIEARIEKPKIIAIVLISAVFAIEAVQLYLASYLLFNANILT